MRFLLSGPRLLVRDFKSCVLFYRDTLGLKPHWGDENGDYASFAVGETHFALFKRPLMAEAVGTSDRPSPVDCQDTVALCFAVDDVDALWRKLKDEGVQFINDPMDRTEWGERVAHFRDPDGNLIEINTSLE